MPDLRFRRDAILTRSARYASLLAVVVLAMALAAAGHSLPTGTSAQRGSASTQRTRPATGQRLDALGRDTARPTGSVEVGHDTDADGPATRIRTTSMDTPIQGGMTAHQEQAQSARILKRHETPATATAGKYWTPAMGRTALARAESWLGMPYSWAGGEAAGPTAGRCDPGNGGDLDCHVVGFDCSGLMMYAWGAYASLPHLAAAQRSAGAFHPTLAELKPGDLVFFSGYLPGGIGHVAIYAGHGSVIEAPQSGSEVRRSSLADVMAADGYRGAVRPLTPATPRLARMSTAIPAKGGLVTLRGTGLSGVDAIHLGSDVVHQIAHRSDSVVTFRAPAHSAGAISAFASTPWRARSAPITLHYAKPAPRKTTAPAPTTSPSPTSPSAPPTSRAPTSPPSSASPTPTSPSPSTSPSKSTSPKPTPTTSSSTPVKKIVTSTVGG